jgi:hypothetical protein
MLSARLRKIKEWIAAPTFKDWQMSLIQHLVMSKARSKEKLKFLIHDTNNQKPSTN